MDELDFSELSDDQVVQLAVAIAREAVRRHPALKAAMDAALATEAERMQAALAGGATAKAEILRRAKLAAHQAELQRFEADAEQIRREAREAELKPLLAEAAQILGRPAQEITCVRHDHASRGTRILINAGTAAEDAPWHLLEYNERTRSLHVSPGLAAKIAALLSWSERFAAAAQRLKIRSRIVLRVL